MSTVEARLSVLESNVSSYRNDFERLHVDYHDEGDRLGIRTKVIILWYGAGFGLMAIGTVFGTVLGYVLHAVFGG